MRYPNVKRIRRRSRTAVERKYNMIWKAARFRHSMKKYEDGNEVLPVLLFEDEIKQNRKNKSKINEDISKPTIQDDMIPIANKFDIRRSRRQSPSKYDEKRPIITNKFSDDRFTKGSDYYHNKSIHKGYVWLNCVLRLNHGEIKEARKIRKERMNQ